MNFSQVHRLWRDQTNCIQYTASKLLLFCFFINFEYGSTLFLFSSCWQVFIHPRDIVSKIIAIEHLIIVIIIIIGFIHRAQPPKHTNTDDVERIPISLLCVWEKCLSDPLQFAHYFNTHNRMPSTARELYSITVYGATNESTMKIHTQKENEHNNKYGRSFL